MSLPVKRKIDILPRDFAPYEAVLEFQQTLDAGQYGASTVFVGTMRDFNEGDDVKAMTLEHYPGMTEKYLEKICDEASEKWQLQACLVQHRVGEVLPGDPIVLVAIWSAHRKDAYEANRFLMEALKSQAPFWKKETLLDDQHRWVEKNTEGY